MSLDVYLEEMRLTEIFYYNITHNLHAMAEEAGIYQHLWHPEELEITHAKQLIEPLTKGLAELRAAPELFTQFGPENEWGNYEGLVTFVTKYLIACIKYPEAEIRTST